MSFFGNNPKIPDELLRFLGSVLGVLKKEKGPSSAAAGSSHGVGGAGSSRDAGGSESTYGTGRFHNSGSSGLNPELSTQQAADLLLMTRAEIEELLDEKRIPFQTKGEERRIRLKDLDRFREQRQTDREKRLEELKSQLKDQEEWRE